MTPLQISEARFKRQQNSNYPVLELRINGKLVQLDAEIKSYFVERGIIPLGEEFADELPELFLAADLEAGVPALTLTGFTNDVRVLKLYLEYADHINKAAFEERELIIPLG